MLSKTYTGALTGLIAAISMTATPTSAAELPQAKPAGSSIYSDFNQSAYDGELAIAEHRRFRRFRGFRGRRGFRGFRHRRGIRAGDILAGAVVIGGIAAIASAANNNRRRDRDVVIVERDRDNRRIDDRRTTRTTAGGSGIDNAVSLCLNEIERDVRVDSVDGASRLAQGWVVTGTLFNGSGFTCQINNNGQIADIDYSGFSGANFDGGAPAGASALRDNSAEGQLSDQRYADARAALNDVRVTAPQLPRGTALAPVSAQAVPAYPGGPLPGEDISDDIDADLNG